MDEPGHVRENMRICDFVLFPKASFSAQSRHSSDNQTDTSDAQAPCPDDDDSACEEIDYNTLRALVRMHAKIPETMQLPDNEQYFSKLFEGLSEYSELIPAWYETLKSDDSQGFSFTNQQFESFKFIKHIACFRCLSPSKKRSNSRN